MQRKMVFTKEIPASENIFLAKQWTLEIGDRIMMNTTSIWHRKLLFPEYKNKTLIGTVKCFTKTGKIGIEFDELIFKHIGSYDGDELYNDSYNNYANLHGRGKSYHCTYLNPNTYKYTIFKDYELIIADVSFDDYCEMNGCNWLE